MRHLELAPELVQVPEQLLLKHIFVPLDGSSCAEEALPMAARLARVAGASLTLVRVVPPQNRYDRYPLNISVRESYPVAPDLQAAQTYMQCVMDTPVLQGIMLDCELLVGSSVSGLLQCAHEHQADLIVMCSHGYTGVERWMKGSVAQQMMRESSIPMLVMRQGSIFYESSREQFSVLVPLDGSDLAEAALAPALHLSQLLSTAGGASLHLLRVVHPVPYVEAQATTITNEGSIMEAQDYLAQVECCLHQEYDQRVTLDITTEVLSEEDVAHTLINLVVNRNEQPSSCPYDALALAVQCHQHIPRWMAGSVAEQILGATYVPLLVLSYPWSKNIYSSPHASAR